MCSQQYRTVPPSVLQRPENYYHWNPARFNDTRHNPAQYPQPFHQLQYSVPNGWPYPQYYSHETYIPPRYDSWSTRDHRSGYQHPDLHRPISLSKSVRAPNEHPVASRGLVEPCLPSKNPEFVFYQNEDFVKSPSRLFVHERLQRSSKAAKQDACLPHGISPKSRYVVRRNPPPKWKADKKQKSLKDFSPGTSQSVSQCRDSTTSPLKTIRIEDPGFDCTSLCPEDSSICLLTHIQSEEGIGTRVLAAIRLWNKQLDLAVEPASDDKLNVQFTNLTRYRLQLADPIFMPQSGCSQEQTTIRALKLLRCNYEKWYCAAGIDKSNDRTRIQAWYAMEIENFNRRITDLEAK